MRVHLINPSDSSFGMAVITPRWLYVLAAATPAQYGDPVITDEVLAELDPARIEPGDVVGIGIHTANALAGYRCGRIARERGAYVVFGGVHASLYPEEARELGGAHSVVRGDGDLVWGNAIADCVNGSLQPVYEGGRIGGRQFIGARWDLMPKNGYMWPTVQTLRGCPKHCSFCSVWRFDGQQPRQRSSDAVISEIVQLRRLGYRFICLADDNFYPVTHTDIALARKQGNAARVAELESIRAERFELMDQLAKLPSDMVLFTQITMEAGEDVGFLEAMRKARIKGVLVGVESVTPEGLKSVYKDFNSSGEDLVQRLSVFKEYGIHVLGSFIFGLSTDRSGTFDITADVAMRANLTVAQFVVMTPLPGTVDFERWEKDIAGSAPTVDGIPITRYWLIPGWKRPKLYTPHPTMSTAEILGHTNRVWDRFYTLGEIWKRAQCVKSIKSRAAFVLLSKLYRQMYVNTGIATDSARRKNANRWARWLAEPCRWLFQAKPMPGLEMPTAAKPVAAAASELISLGG